VAPRRGGALRVNALFGGGGDKDGGGGIGGMGNLMENMRKAQSLVQNEAGRVQQELSECAPVATVLSHYNVGTEPGLERGGLRAARALRVRRCHCARVVTSHSESNAVLITVWCLPAAQSMTEHMHAQNGF
jgi:hypothetical protein